MTDAQITRQQIIVVDTIGENQYKDLTFKDKEGNDYKISNKRAQYFKHKILPSQAVQLNYTVAYGKEFIYSAELVKDILPVVTQKPVEPSVPVNLYKTVPLEKVMSKDDWNEKDRITRKSIERQKSIDLGVRVCELSGIKTGITKEAITAARAFEAYIETGKEYLGKEVQLKGNSH